MALPIFKRKAIAKGTTTEQEYTFKENFASIRHLRAEIKHKSFVKLVKAFKIDKNKPRSSYAKWDIAGFCFIPIQKGAPNIIAKEYSFSTIGFRVVLVLWEPLVISTGLSVKAMRFYEFNPARKLLDALDPEFDSGAIKAQAFFEVHIGITPASWGISGLTDPTKSAVLETKMYNPSNIIFNSREFDLVFIDYSTYESLATSGHWYEGGVREAGVEGIIIERSVNNFLSTINHRTLRIRPLPTPKLDSVEPTPAAVAYDYRPHCPPYWIGGLEESLTAEFQKSPTFQVALSRRNGNGEDTPEEGLVGDTSPEPTSSGDNSKGLPRWLQILILILSIIIAYLVGNGGFGGFFSSSIG